MDEKELFAATSSLVLKDFDLQPEKPIPDEKALIDILADLVAWYIEKNRLEALFQILYRLDVDEHKIHKAFDLSSDEPANLLVAKIILDREKKRVLTRAMYKSSENPDWFDF